MAGEKVKIKKVLTHDFEVKGEVQNFDDIMQKILDDVRDKVTFLSFEYKNASIFKANSITNLIVNVKQQIEGSISYPIVHGLVGLSLGNQSLNLISFELQQTEATKNEPVHDRYILQIYNPTEVDIVSNVKLQLVCNGSY